MIDHWHTVDANAHERVSCAGMPLVARFTGRRTYGTARTDTDRWRG